MVRSQAAGALIFVALFALGAIWNFEAFDREAARMKRWEPDVVTLPRPEVVKLLSLGNEAVLADLYWIGAVHYLGDLKNQRVSYGGLSNYIDLVTALAPDFKYAYVFGGMAVPWNRGDRWVNVEAGVRILERGVQRFPQDWFMREMLAYYDATFLGRYREAGDQLSRAALVPGAPRWLGSLATRMYATEGDLDRAQDVAQDIFQQTNDEGLRALMQQRARELATLKDEKNLNAAVQQYKQRFGAFPPSLQSLVTAGILTDLPAESLGGTFSYDPATGRVRSTTLNSRLEIFKKPASKP